MAILSKFICRFSAILFRIPAGFFEEIDKMILNSLGRIKGPRIAKTFFKRNKVGEPTLPDFKTYYKAIGIKTRRCGRNVIENLETNSRLYPIVFQ
jgi:hypothetical protein